MTKDTTGTKIGQGAVRPLVFQKVRGKSYGKRSTKIVKQKSTNTAPKSNHPYDHTGRATKMAPKASKGYDKTGRATRVTPKSNYPYDNTGRATKVTPKSNHPYDNTSRATHNTPKSHFPFNFAKAEKKLGVVQS